MRKFETVSIADATTDQLRQFAERFLGLPVQDDDDSAVLAKIKAAHEGDTIFIEPDVPATDQTGAPPRAPGDEIKGGGIVGSLGRDDPKVTLTLHAEDRDGVVVNRHKEVGCNGVVWLLKRGESITIPYRVFHSLNNAERHVITHTSEGEQREQVVKNTPFNIEKMPSADEIAAWHKQTDDAFTP